MDLDLGDLSRMDETDVAVLQGGFDLERAILWDDHGRAPGPA
jgi:hypothetical protein